MGRKARVAEKSKTSQAKTSRSSKRANTVHQPPKPPMTLKRSTIKSARSNPDVMVVKNTKSRAGKAHSAKASKAKQVPKSSHIVKYKKQRKPTQKSQEPKGELAPIVKKLAPTTKDDYHKLMRQNIEKADAYQQQRAKTRAKKQSRFSISPTFATVAVLFILTGYVAYLNIPHISLRVAGSQAGFSARVPGYSPQGFAQDGPIEYTKGEITLNFSSSSTEKSYKIIERKSNWDSLSLLENHVKNQPGEYLTYYDRGVTVYIINEDTATWVNGGIWYSVQSDALLNSEQLLKIASSL